MPKGPCLCEDQYYGSDGFCRFMIKVAPEMYKHFQAEVIVRVNEITAGDQQYIDMLKDEIALLKYQLSG